MTIHISPGGHLPDLRALGSFPDVVQVVPTLEHVHELVSDPTQPGFAGGGDLIYHGGSTIKGGRVFNVYISPVSISTSDFDAFTAARDAAVQMTVPVLQDVADAERSSYL